jgi:hypothetical protein
VTVATPGQDPAPEELVDRAKGLFAKRAKGELAELVFDSLVDGDDTAAGHDLRFEHPGLAIEIHVSAAPPRSHLTAYVTPAAVVRAELEFAAGESALPDAVSSPVGARSVDNADGVLTFSTLPHGVVRLRLIRAEPTAPIHTDWFRI